jgi:hypothetical protein
LRDSDYGWPEKRLFKKSRSRVQILNRRSPRGPVAD